MHKKANRLKMACVFGWHFLVATLPHLIELFEEIDDLIDLIYFIDMLNLIDSVILIAYV